MAAGLLYELRFLNTEDTSVRVTIADNSIVLAEGATPQIIQLNPAGEPLKISTVDNAERKFNPIKAQQAVISFLSNSETSLNTFAEGADDRFEVTILYGAAIIFRGFLSLSDNQEAFLPPRNVVTLVANDKLAALKDIPFTDFDGANPAGKYRIAALLAMALSKTGLALEMRVVNNLRHGTGQKQYLSTFGSPSDPFILMDNASAAFFYVGQKVTITGTASNNVTFTVISVNTGFVGVIGASVNFALEADVLATYTDTTSEGHIYDTTYLDAKTLEKEVGVSINCYDVLSRILGYDCILIQRLGAWWIIRIDELDLNPLYIFNFDTAGILTTNYSDNLFKNIGHNETHWLSEEATIWRPQRPLDFVKLTYNFNYPVEIICNGQYERGDFIEDLPDEVNEDGITEQVKAYELDCWANEGRTGPSVWDNYNGPVPTGASIFVKKFYQRGYERFRELVIEGTPGSGGGVAYVESQSIPVGVGDMIRLGVSVYYTNIGSSTGFTNSPVLVYLLGRSGTRYWWKAGNIAAPEMLQQWVATADNLPVENWYLGANVEDPNINLSFESPPLPESGELVIILINEYGDSVQAHYSQPDLSITSLINGGYQQYKGIYNKVSRTDEGYKAILEDEVFIADAERALYKGAMFLFIDGNYDLTKLWYPAAKYALGYPTDLTDVRPFGEIQVFAVWNQYRLANRVFEAQAQGLGSDTPDSVHRYTITDASPVSASRLFFMVTFDKDYFLCGLKGTLEQIYNSVEGKIYTDPYELKYLTKS